MFHALHVLVITSDPNVCTVLSIALENEGHASTCVANPQEALSLIDSGTSQDLILFDMSRQPPGSMYLLEALVKRIGKEKLCLLIPMGMNLWNKDAERLGVQHVLRKPLQRHDVERMLVQMGTSMGTSMRTSMCGETRGEMRGESSVTSGMDCAASNVGPCYVEDLTGGRYFLASSAAMKKIYSTVRLLALVDVPVLILGESGVGKDVVASLLHAHSLRSQESYLSVNCAALPSDLLESELFGYEAGAFTGAVKAKPGKFELAHRGTLLLDEIGEMSAPMQAKLLHVLQDGRFSRLGARAVTQVDVRVVAATNIDIEDAIANHSFREDLYYRISAFTITVPPLRERRDEIPFFVAEMLSRHGATFRQEAIQLSSQLMTAMQEYSWPGNLRELSNFVIRMLILQDQRTALADLEVKMRSKRNLSLRESAGLLTGEPAQDFGSMRSIVRNLKDQTESRLIQEALDAAGWNRRHAAVQLRISYRALLYKIQHYNLRETGSPLQTRLQ